LIADYHIHTPYCGHASGKIVQYIENAVAQGFQEIGFSDHLGRYYLTRLQRKRYWNWGMEERDLARYFSELNELRDVFANKITIRVGLEVDFVEGAEDILEPILSMYPFDFCIGSIHCLPRFGWKHISEYSGAANINLYKEYFRLAQLALHSKLFHSLAHVDFIWRYLKWPQTFQDIIYSELANTIRTAAATNTCIEINANGFVWAQANSPAAIDPFNFLLDQIKLFNAPITIGSDAHEPDMVGKSFGPIIKSLLSKQITKIYCFEDGRPRQECLG
jgi:histidinol-phosphatase (PHP family)